MKSKGNRFAFDSKAQEYRAKNKLIPLDQHSQLKERRKFFSLILGRALWPIFYIVFKLKGKEIVQCIIRTKLHILSVTVTMII